MNTIAAASHLQQLPPPPPFPCYDNFKLDMNVSDGMDKEVMMWDDMDDDKDAHNDMALQW